MPTLIGRLRHASAYLLRGVREVWPVCRQVVGSSHYASVSRRLLRAQLFLIISFLYLGFLFSWSYYRIGFLQLQLLYDEVGMPLVWFQPPSFLGASYDSV